MPTFQGNPFSNFYKRILQISQSSNTGVDESGDGVSTSLSLSDDVLQVQPQNDDTTGTFLVKNSSGTELLKVDSTNSLVKALDHNVNTQYATFGINATDSASLTANNHYAIPYQVNSYSDTSNMPTFGTGTDPATTFTTADTNGQYASQIVPMMWYVPDNISIDEVTSIEGADAGTGDTTRMHLYSYTFNSGSTSALASGTLLAHNSDVTNAGNEQGYKSTWTIDSSSVAGGKVVLAFIRMDSVNADYSLNITVKYHLV